MKNGQAVSIGALPDVPFKTLRRAVIEAVSAGARISALPVWRQNGREALRLAAVLSRPESGVLTLMACDLPDTFPALTLECPAAHWFEREMAETWGCRPEGHPFLKPIRFSPLRHGASKETAQIGLADFLHMAGGESHEVAVGPVHAGVIEPGHFRFLCHGETVYHLEISLGYQHRGVERAMTESPPKRRIHYMETLAGDTTIGHGTAYCRLMEALSDSAPPPARAEGIRALAAELERIANHIGDLGALAGDVGFLPSLSYCGRIRGDVLNMSATLCGNRFGRGLVRPGGVAFDLGAAMTADLLSRLDAVERDVTSAVELMFEAPSVLARFEKTGALSRETARRIGLVGVAARACGLSCDVRQEHPYGMYRFLQVTPATWSDGDCFARAYVRWLEIKASIAFLRRLLKELPQGAISRDTAPTRPEMLAVSLVEGWRGEICHVAATDSRGELAFYKVVDPSFHNWFGLALCLRNQQISDFPLCNKSFNLSYCGHDL
jgi:Ni,Fe-hydrogenase III large subunit